MFKTTTDLGPIPDEMTKDADKDHTISPLPPVPMSEITPIPQQRTRNTWNITIICITRW